MRVCHCYQVIFILYKTSDGSTAGGGDKMDITPPRGGIGYGYKLNKTKF